MKIFILTTILAPYRVEYFNELGKYCELTVCFETKTEEGRDEEWYKSDFNNFKAIFLKDWDKPQVRIKKDIFKHIKNNDYDIAIAFEYSTPTALLFMLKNIINHKLYCINIDGGFISNNIIKSAVKQFFIKRAGACLASGNMAAQYLMHYGCRKEQIFYHNFSSLREREIIEGPITKRHKELLKRDLNIKEKKIILSVGQFIYRKGFDVLLEACTMVSKEFGVYIVGGQPIAEYIAIKEKYKLKNVHFVGFKNKEELKKYYMASDLFVLPTREDIWGLVINEAMAYGLPIITTNRCIAGLELVDNDNGRIVPMNDARKLAEGINELLDNDQMLKLMSENSLKKIRPYTIENMVKVHMNIFKNII